MIASKSFGIVVYMDNKSYSDKISNTNIHFPITKEQTAIQLFKAFYDIGLGKYEVENIVIGHEHGEENNKCHMQIYLKFTEKIRKYIKPGSFIANNTTFLYMTQKCKTPAKMRNYCSFVVFYVCGLKTIRISSPIFKQNILCSNIKKVAARCV